MPTFEPVMPPQLTGLGAVERLETRLAAYYGVRYAVAMPSATTGLMAVGLALGLRGADCVAPPLSYGGSNAGWLVLGANIRFADIDADSLTLSPGAVTSAVTPATRAILGVDLFGTPCNDRELRTEADRHGLWFVVDAAQSLGGRIDGRPAGQLADALVVSFTAGKALDAGEGGAVLTDRRDVYEQIIWHSQHPYRQKRELGLHRVNELAINGRIHPEAASMACREFDAALRRIERRRTLMRRICERLGELPEVDVPRPAAGVEPSYHRLTVRQRVPAAHMAITRDLARLGVGSSVGTIPASVLYRHPCFSSMSDYWSRLCPALEHEWRVRVGIYIDELSLLQGESQVDAALLTA